MDYIGLTVFCQYNNLDLNTLQALFIRAAYDQNQLLKKPIYNLSNN